jgi:hypothetical protein
VKGGGRGKCEVLEKRKIIIHAWNNLNGFSEVIRELPPMPEGMRCEPVGKQ